MAPFLEIQFMACSGQAPLQPWQPKPLLPQQSTSCCSENDIMVPFLRKQADQMAPVVEKDQQEPHCPWFLIGETAPLVLQSMGVALTWLKFSTTESSWETPKRLFMRAVALNSSAVRSENTVTPSLQVCWGFRFSSSMKRRLLRKMPYLIFFSTRLQDLPCSSRKASKRSSRDSCCQRRQPERDISPRTSNQAFILILIYHLDIIAPYQYRLKLHVIVQKRIQAVPFSSTVDSYEQKRYIGAVDSYQACLSCFLLITKLISKLQKYWLALIKINLHDSIFNFELLKRKIEFLFFNLQLLMLRKIQNACSWLREIDLFSARVSWLHSGEEYSTKCGAVISLLAIGIIILACYSTLQTFFSYSDFTVTTSQGYNYPESPLFLNRSQFDHAIVIQNYNYEKPSYQVLYNVVQTIKGVTTYSPYIPAVPCNITQWEANFGLQAANKLKQYGGLPFCMPPSLNFTISGSLANDGRFVVVGVYKCRAPACFSSAQMRQKVKPFKLVSFYTNIQYKLDKTKFFNYQLSIPQTKTFDPLKPDRIGLNLVSLSDYSVDDSKSDVWPNSFQFMHQNRTFKSFQIDTDSMGGYPSSTASIFQVDFIKSGKWIQVSRQIYKVEDLISFIGGVFGVVLSIFALVGRHYNEQALKLDLMKNVRFTQEADQTPAIEDYNFLHMVSGAVAGPCIREDLNGNRLQKIEFLHKAATLRLSVDHLLTRIDRLQNFAKLKGVELKHIRELYEQHQQAQMLVREDEEAQVDRVELVSQQVQQRP